MTQRVDAFRDCASEPENDNSEMQMSVYHVERLWATWRRRYESRVLL
jgi:hypothetical protein